jgi:hypothetical protein
VQAYTYPLIPRRKRPALSFIFTMLWLFSWPVIAGSLSAAASVLALQAI